MVAEIAALIPVYKYWGILAVALFEAPLMSIVIGFFAVTGQLNLGLAFGIVALGDFIGDTVLYAFGRWCRPWLQGLGARLPFSPAHLSKVVEYFGRRDRHAIVISKLVHGVGFTGLIAAGSLRVPYSRFIVTCVVVSVLQSAVLVAAGMLSGEAYQSFAFWFGTFDALVAAVGVIGLFILYRTVVRKVGERDRVD